jgi:hypothetical protein
VTQTPSRQAGSWTDSARVGAIGVPRIRWLPIYDESAHLLVRIFLDFSGRLFPVKDQ